MRKIQTTGQWTAPFSCRAIQHAFTLDIPGDYPELQVWGGVEILLEGCWRVCILSLPLSHESRTASQKPHLHFDTVPLSTTTSHLLKGIHTET